MKEINFITPVPQNKQREVRMWFSSTVALLCVIVCTVGFLHMVQIKILKKVSAERRALAQKISGFDAALEEHHKLKQQEQLLASRLQEIDKQTENPKNPVDYLSCIAGACAQRIDIQSLKIEQDTVEIMAQCAHENEVTNFIEKLNTSSHFNELTLVSLTNRPTSTNQKAIVFTLHGMLSERTYAA